jgi:hypothetical protein
MAMKRCKITLPIFFAALAASLAQQGVEVHHTFRGEELEGLRPEVILTKVHAKWHMDLGFEALKDFGLRTWLEISNGSGAKLVFWSTNDAAAVPLLDAETIAAERLPLETTVSEAMRGVQRSRRAMQWLRTFEGEFTPTASFNLDSALGKPLTNDLLVEITPLLYRVSADEQKARLVSFPPFKFELKVNGEVVDLRRKERE